MLRSSPAFSHDGQHVSVWTCRLSVCYRLLYDERFVTFYPERVVFINGAILNVIHAQSEISHKLHELRCRDRVSLYFSSLYSLIEPYLFLIRYSFYELCRNQFFTPTFSSLLTCCCVYSDHSQWLNFESDTETPFCSAYIFS